MTIRVPPQLQSLDKDRLASVITMAVLHPVIDDEVRSDKPGLRWVRWSDTQKLPEPTPQLD